MSTDKLRFLREQFIIHLKSLNENTPPVFGKMNLRQMIEHMSDSVRIANAKDLHTIITPAERLQPMKDFLMSGKDMRPNTVNPLMPVMPVPCRLPDKASAISELEAELADFVNHFEKNPGSIVVNPFFGELNFEEWTLLLYKHSLHHLRQFGVEI